MPETPELEAELERVQETINEAREGAREDQSLLRRISLSTALVAVVAAVAALQAGSTVNEALLKKNDAFAMRTEAFDAWAQYQAKGIKSAVLQSQKQTLIAFDKAPALLLDEDIARYRKEQAEIAARAERTTEASRRLQEESDHLLHRHHRYASAVALLQVAVALSAIAALSRSRPMWALSIATAAVGALVFLDGFVLLV